MVSTGGDRVSSGDNSTRRLTGMIKTNCISSDGTNNRKLQLFHVKVENTKKSIIIFLVEPGDTSMFFFGLREGAGDE